MLTQGTIAIDAMVFFLIVGERTRTKLSFVIVLAISPGW
jgi:hypothetical protein